jgi:hypothetical protein
MDSSVDWVAVISSGVTAFGTLALTYYAWVTIREGRKNRRKDTVETMLREVYSPLYDILRKALYEEGVRAAYRSSHSGLDWVVMHSERERMLEIIAKYGHYFDDEKEFNSFSNLLSSASHFTIDSGGLSFLFGFTDIEMSKHLDYVGEKRKELRNELYGLTKV